jgi:sigma-B regulation protein RsbU (phosphoserine phosphatase)
LLYTDGVIESRNKAGEDFGYDRLIPIVEAAAATHASEIQKTVIRALYSFTEHTELNDDYTLLVIKFI